MRNHKIMAFILALCVGLGGVMSAVAEAAEPVTLRFLWWGSDARHEATLRVIDDYMALHPNVKIEAMYGTDDGYYEKLTTMLASGTEPDIIQMIAEGRATHSGAQSYCASGGIKVPQITCI